MVPFGRVAAINPRVGGSTATNGAEEVAFLPMDAISEGGFVAYQQRRRISEVTNGYTCFKRGDILLAKITPCMENGKAAHLQALETESGFGSTEFHVIRPSDDLDGRYAFYLIWNPRFRHLAECRMTGSAGQKRVPASFLKELEIPLPPLAEQRRIAAILDKADAIRRKHEQALALADDFLRSTFLHMFGDPVTNPKGYGVVQLDKAAEIKSGLTKGRNLNGRLSVSLPYMRVANVQDGHIDLSDVKNIEVAEDEVNRFLLCPGDILLTEGGDPDKLGRGSVWQGQINPCVHQNHIFRVRCDSSVADPVFVSSQIGSARGKAYFLRSAKQTTGIASINKTQLREFPLLLPAVHEQTRYAAIVKQIGKWRSNLTSAVCLAQNAFSSLSQRAFRGEL